MFPFWAFFLNNRKAPRQENIRVFKIVFYFLAAVAVSFVIVTYLVFGHF